MCQKLHLVVHLLILCATIKKRNLAITHCVTFVKRKTLLKSVSDLAFDPASVDLIERSSNSTPSLSFWWAWDASIGSPDAQIALNDRHRSEEHCPKCVGSRFRRIIL